MKNKGFTLVEIMGVIVILAVLVLVAVPSVISVSHKIKDKLYEDKRSMILNAARLYAQDHMEDIENATYMDIYVKTLVRNNYLKKDDNSCNISTSNPPCILDPRDNTGMDDLAIRIKIVNKRPDAVWRD